MQHVVERARGADGEAGFAARALAGDLAAVLGRDVPCVAEGEAPGDAVRYLVGATAASPDLARWAPVSDGAQWGRIVSVAGDAPRVFLAGHDAAGARRAAHAFSRDVLGVDPCAYWSGTRPPRKPDFLPPALDRAVPPPAVPTLCYFDNDNDELANLRPPLLEFDKETWAALIDSLLRMGYNAIDLHDHLGRSEFHRWDAYKALRPDYHTNLELIDWVIDYAHARGMRVQIPMYLAWEFLHLTEEEAVCWTRHGGRWRELWTRYLKETPLGKADLFLDRPRSQLWDYEYLSACGEETGAAMTAAFTALRDIVLDHNPDATLICDLYAHGMDLWRGGTFQPPKDYVLLWPNDGYGRLHPFPGDTRGHRFGGYVHAGFWLNHEVQDPYPKRIEQTARRLIREHGAGAYLLVNGQNFRPFTLNLEAWARAAADPAGFDGAAFHREWAARHFGAAAAPRAVAAQEALHAASGEGYVRLMHDLMARLEDCRTRRRAEDVAALRAALCQNAERLEQLEGAAGLAEEAMAAAGGGADYCHDALVLPMRIFAETQAIHNALLGAWLAWNEDEAETAQARAAQAAALLRAHLETRARGDRDPRWAGWYDPARRRPNGGFPTVAAIEALWR